jgi:L-threonylcarbamoyladenylate synthase
MKMDIERALKVLKGGGTILYPTDTIWGIGCLSTDPAAVKKVYDIKKRRDTKSMLVLLDDGNRLPSYVDEVPDVAWELIDAADKPLTIIYPCGKNLAENLLSEDKSIGIRIADDDFCRQLIQKLRRPIVSTSANFADQPSPSFFEEIDPEIIDAVDYVVEWRQEDLTPATASSIIKLGAGGQISIIRK